MAGVNVDDIQALSDLITALDKYQDELSELGSKMQGLVDSSDSWWHDELQGRFESSWSDSYKGLLAYIDSLPDLNKFLQNVKKYLEDMHSLKL
jgi:uncharacterized protein YukE